VYLERFEGQHINEPTQQALADLIANANDLGEIAARTGKSEPTVVT
jgi:phosphoglucomutase